MGFPFPLKFDIESKGRFHVIVKLTKPTNVRDEVGFDITHERINKNVNKCTLPPTRKVQLQESPECSYEANDVYFFLTT